MKNTIVGLLVVLTTLFCYSCTTYTIPVDSFKEQFAGIDSSSLKKVKVRYPSGMVHEGWANPIDSISCLDKNNVEHKLKNKPSLEIKFTTQNNKSVIFYFHSIYLQDSLIIGDRSMFISYGKALHIDDVKKIEIQDGHKKFSYVKAK